MFFSVLQMLTRRKGKERGSLEETWALVLVPAMCLALGDGTGSLGRDLRGSACPSCARSVMGPRGWKEAVGREEALKWEGRSAPALRACWAWGFQVDPLAFPQGHIPPLEFLLDALGHWRPDKEVLFFPYLPTLAFPSSPHFPPQSGAQA